MLLAHGRRASQLLRPAVGQSALAAAPMSSLSPLVATVPKVSVFPGSALFARPLPGAFALSGPVRGFLTWARSPLAQSGILGGPSAFRSSGLLGGGAQIQQIAWTSVKRKRVSKMNKHKLKKLRKRYRMQSKSKKN